MVENRCVPQARKVAGALPEVGRVAYILGFPPSTHFVTV